MAVKHKKVSAIADGGNSNLVRPSDWNLDHDVSYNVASVSVNTTLDATNEVIRATAGSGGITITLPTAVGINGRVYRIKRVDAGAGNVTIATTLSQTIDGDTSYLLVNQFQYVILLSNNATWDIIGNN